MFVNEELILPIKSRYPLIFFESVDEEYAINQLAEIANTLILNPFQWSVTEELRINNRDNSYYETKDPLKIIRTLISLFDTPNFKPSIFTLIDFDKYLDDPVLLRYFKDLVNIIKKTKHTLIMLASKYNLPKDLEPYTAHISGGYPNEHEIRYVLIKTVEELKRMSMDIKMSLDEKNLEKIIKTLKGLSTQQIKNILNKCIVDNNILN